MIALVGEAMAKPGIKFVFEGLTSECRKCKFFKVCSNLTKGRVYEVKRARRIKHKCPLHGNVVVVEVELAKVNAAIKSQIAVEGAIITFRPIECSTRNCQYRILCRPLGLFRGDKCKIIKIKGKIKCPKGLNLYECLLEIMT